MVIIFYFFFWYPIISYCFFRIFWECDPLAIRWAIISVAIYSVDTQITLVAVGERPEFKDQVIIYPQAADFNSPGSIILEAVVIFTVASIFHATPDSVEPGFTIAMFCCYGFSFYP